MTLTTHAIVGGAMAVIVPSAPAAIVIAFASHFVLDALPHRDYVLRSFEKHPDDRLADDMPAGPSLIHDLFHTGLDAFLGVSLALLLFSVTLFHASPLLVVCCACAGILPDFLQFVYFKTRTPILRALQRFHHVWIQNEIAVSPQVGLSLQAAFVVLGLIVMKVVLA